MRVEKSSSTCIYIYVTIYIYILYINNIILIHTRFFYQSLKKYIYHIEGWPCLGSSKSLGRCASETGASFLLPEEAGDLTESPVGYVDVPGYTLF